MIENLPFTIKGLANAYGQGLRPELVVAEAFRRLDLVADEGIFIHEARAAALEAAALLGEPDGRPLWGIPFAVKDNIDVAGMPTTAACPDAVYDAQADAFVVARLKDAGAICLGKTNLDQFATGLVGVRTPYAIARNAIDPAIVPGGSSSGSAVVVAHGIAAFALGTDTAGSGRVPAALNSIVGLKPSLGALSSTGMLPACRTLDTISIFAMSVADAWSVFDVAAAYDPADAYSRKIPTRQPAVEPTTLKIGVPTAQTLVTFGDTAQAASFRDATGRLRESGAEIVEIDFEPFYAVARMLYEGAWLAERVAAVGSRLVEKPETLHPTTRAILEPGLKLSAADAFKGMYRLEELKRVCAGLLAGVDAFCVPTIPTFVTLAEIADDPIGPNSRLGTYTNFANLLDLCGMAAPTRLRTDGRPGSVTFLAPAGHDALCAGLAASVEGGPMGATGWARPVTRFPSVTLEADELAIAVCGAHMRGLPLNGQLTSLGGRFMRAVRSAPVYGLHALAGGPPQRPGMVRKAEGGQSIELEVWALPSSSIGDLLARIPSPLGLGTIALEDGTAVKGFICESAGLAGSTDISNFGGWRAYLADGEKPARAVA